MTEHGHRKPTNVKKNYIKNLKYVQHVFEPDKVLFQAFNVPFNSDAIYVRACFTFCPFKHHRRYIQPTEIRLALKLNDCSLLNLFQWLDPDYKCMCSDPLWSCLCLSCVLTSDRHWAICIVSVYMCFTVIFHRWGRGPLCGSTTVKPRWLEHRWLDYLGWFKFIFESHRNSSDKKANILGKFSYFIMKLYVYVLIRIASSRRF